MKQRVVIIKQVGGTSRLPENTLPETTRKIGSKFSRQTGSVLVGLNDEECNYILPSIIRNNEQNNSLDWSEKIKRFYAELSIDVPYGEGTRLDIATTKKKVKGMDGETKEIDFPNHPLDYIKWKQCLADHSVATTEHELRHKSNFKFYLEEQDKERNRTLQITSEINKLDKLYLVLVAEKEEGVFKQPDKVDAVLRLLGENPNIYSHEEKTSQLGLLRDESKKSLREGTPLEMLPFFKTVNDPNLGIKSEIMTYVSLSFLEREGDYYREPSTNKVIGSNLDEAVMFFKDSNNEDVVQKLRFKVRGVEETV